MFVRTVSFMTIIKKVHVIHVYATKNCHYTLC